MAKVQLYNYLRVESHGFSPKWFARTYFSDTRLSTHLKHTQMIYPELTLNKNGAQFVRRSFIFHLSLRRSRRRRARRRRRFRDRGCARWGGQGDEALARLCPPGGRHRFSRQGQQRLPVPFGAA